MLEDILLSTKYYKVIEVDLALTKDHIPVLSHRFSFDNEICFAEKPDLSTFLKFPFANNYTPLTLDEFYKKFFDFSNFFLFDCAFGDEKEIYKFIKKYPNEFLKKIIFQVHNINFAYSVYRDNFVGYIHYNFSTIKQAYRNINLLKKMNIHTISISDDQILNNTCLNVFKDNNIYVFAYTVNHQRRLKFLLNAGVSGVFTDKFINKNN